MQGPEEKKHVGKHAGPAESVKNAEEDVLRADADLYGDEIDIPIRPRKKKASPSSGKGKKKKSKKGKKKQTFASRLFDPAASTRFRKRRTLFEIMSTSSDHAVFKPISLFGFEIRFWPVILLVLLVMLITSVFMNNSSIAPVQDTVTIVGLPADLENYKILVISDLNGRRFGDKQSSLLRAINNQSYNAVFFLGDMVGKDGDPEPFYELLEGIPSSKKVFFICGDSDPGPFVDTPRNITDTLTNMVLEDWILGAIERGATYVDSPVCMTVGSSNVWITPSTLMNYEAAELMNTWKDQTAQEEDGVLSGLQADYNTLPITSYRYRIAQNFNNSVGTMKEEDFYLTLSHEVPSDEFILCAASHNAESGKYISEPELLLAGHYCGGVWKLPVLGAFYVPDNMKDRNGWFPASEKVQGLSTVGETQVYITGGLSTNSDTPAMFFRLFNQPEISVLTLTATLPENMLSAE